MASGKKTFSQRHLVFWQSPSSHFFPNERHAVFIKKDLKLGTDCKVPFKKNKVVDNLH